MAVEDATYIAGLEPEWPQLDADISEGDDHIRLCKSVMIKTFPGADGDGFKKPIIATEDELNRVSGVSSPIQLQLDALDSNKIGDSGNQAIEGTLDIDGSLIVNSLDSGGYNGMNIKDSVTNQWGALFNFNVDTKQVNIRQVGDDGTGGSQPSLGDPETQLNIKEGQVVMSAFGPTDPVYPKSLTTKEYVESAFVAKANDQEISGTLTVHEEVRVIADTVGQGDGYTIYMPDAQDNNTLKLRAATYFEESDGTYRFIIADSSGVAQTLMVYYPEGELRIDGAVVLTTGNTALLMSQATASAGGVSGTFEDNNGKIVTVSDGLITGLG